MKMIQFHTYILSNYWFIHDNLQAEAKRLMCPLVNFTFNFLDRQKGALVQVKGSGKRYANHVNNFERERIGYLV